VRANVKPKKHEAIERPSMLLSVSYTVKPGSWEAGKLEAESSKMITCTME
jgi:hypothetical protein